MTADDAALITVAHTSLEPVRAGRLIALVSVSMTVVGVGFQVLGLSASQTEIASKEANHSTFPE